MRFTATEIKVCQQKRGTEKEIPEQIEEDHELKKNRRVFSVFSFLFSLFLFLLLPLVPVISMINASRSNFRY